MAINNIFKKCKIWVHKTKTGIIIIMTKEIFLGEEYWPMDIEIMELWIRIC